MCSSRSRLIASSIAASEVVLPEPVGPVTSTKPRGLRVNSSSTAGSPSSSSDLISLRDVAEGGADRAALEEAVDAEAGDVRDRVGEVELQVVLEALALVVVEDRVDDLAGLLRGQRPDGPPAAGSGRGREPPGESPAVRCTSEARISTIRVSTSAKSKSLIPLYFVTEPRSLSGGRPRAPHRGRFERKALFSGAAAARSAWRSLRSLRR